MIAGCKPAETGIGSEISDETGIGLSDSRSDEKSESESEVFSSETSKVITGSPSDESSSEMISGVSQSVSAPEPTVTIAVTPTNSPSPTNTPSPTPTQAPLPEVKPYSLEVVSGEWIYYIDRETNEYNAIYKKRADGSQKTKVIEAASFEGEMGTGYDSLSYLRINSDRLYYVGYEHTGLFGGSANGKIYSCKTDGSDVKLIYRGADRIWIYNGKIYYSADGYYGGYLEEEYRGTFRMDLDGKNIVKLNDYQAFGMNGPSGRFYYIIDYMHDEGVGTYYCNFDGTGSTRFAEMYFENDILHVDNEWIYYLNGDTVNKVKFDGTGQTEVTD